MEKKRPRYTVIDNETGEIVAESRSKPVVASDVENYLKVFYKNPLFRSGLSGSTFLALFALASHMPYSTFPSSMQIDTGMRKKIEKEFGIGPSSLERYLSDLTKRNCLYRVERGKYIINPYLFGKGTGASILERRSEWSSIMDEHA